MVLNVLSMGLPPAHEVSIAEWLDELKAFLSRQDIDSEFSFKFLGQSELATAEGTLGDGGVPSSESLGLPSGAKTVIVAPFDSRLGHVCRGHWPDNTYGSSVPEAHTSYVYELNDPFTLWHEILHLYKAEDCYTEEDPGPTCGDPNCIMQSGIRQQTVTTQPWLCSENLRRCRDWNTDSP